ncbi:MAG TPA: ferritin-like fold-containing protein [Chloroflexota bacterium]|nr:ferritin-like fold-containing protein [Chloroflexota bacterium]
MTTISKPRSSAARDAVYADIFSQAITGELIGMANYAAMVRLYPDVEGQCDALEHAATELGHSKAFRRAARELGVTPIVNPAAPYWKRIRVAFLKAVDAGDLTACLLIQEVMLESFAVAMYQAVAEVEDEDVAKVFRRIAAEEQGHVGHAVEELRGALAADQDAFEAKLETLHDEVMTTLAQMLGSKDSIGHCELCHGSCVKGSLPKVGLNRADMRGRALNHYLRTLDLIGVRGERSLAWVARLPL